MQAYGNQAAPGQYQAGPGAYAGTGDYRQMAPGAQRGPGMGPGSPGMRGPGPQQYGYGEAALLPLSGIFNCLIVSETFIYFGEVY